jgi:hypothetical protein
MPEDRRCPSQRRFRHYDFDSDEPNDTRGIRLMSQRRFVVRASAGSAAERRPPSRRLSGHPIAITPSR